MLKQREAVEKRAEFKEMDGHVIQTRPEGKQKKEDVLRQFRSLAPPLFS
jgi:hypothetical protein